MNAPIFEHVTIIGLGLIGGSIARALRENNIAEHITGCDNSKITSTKALKMGVIDHAENDPTRAVQKADLVIFCTPLDTYAMLTKEINNNLIEGCIICDVGSAKQSAIDNISGYLNKAHLPYFIPSHPIAGSERTGIDAGYADLFNNKKTIITPLDSTDKSAIKKVTLMWESCGAICEHMSATRHDDIYATVSHLPHFLAFCYALMLKRTEHTLHWDKNVARFLRITNSSVPMWRDIFFHNKQSTLQAIHSFLETLNNFAKIDSKALYMGLLHAKKRRESIKFEATRWHEDNSHDVITYTLPKIIACVCLDITEDLDYVGSGFRDFTFPLLDVPEHFIELLDLQHGNLHSSIKMFKIIVSQFASTIENGSLNDIEEQLTLYSNSFKAVLKTIDCI